MDTGPINFKVLDRASIPPQKPVAVKTSLPSLLTVVPRTLTDPHLLVVKWLKHTQSAKTHEGHLAIEKMHVLDTRISAAQVDR
jgi:hypothetical protein